MILDLPENDSKDFPPLSLYLKFYMWSVFYLNFCQKSFLILVLIYLLIQQERVGCKSAVEAMREIRQRKDTWRG